MTHAESQQKYKQSFKGKQTEKKYRKNHKIRFKKEYGISVKTDLYRTKRDKVFEKLGNICVVCGFSDKRALQIDHIKGGGSKERHLLTHTTFLHKVLTDKSNSYQILCANCNWIKRYENNEWYDGGRR